MSLIIINVPTPPDGPRCDFCSGRPVVARYYAQSFDVVAYSTSDFTSHSEGDWAACSTCACLLDAGRWDELVAHSASEFYKHHPECADLPEAVLTHALHGMYAQLRANGFRKELIN